MASLTPETGDGLPDRGIVAGRTGVDEAGVCDFSLGRRIDSVDLRMCQCFEVLISQASVAITRSSSRYNIPVCRASQLAHIHERVLTTALHCRPGLAVQDRLRE